MTAPAMQPGHLLAGKYRVEKQLGQGGMGAVYLCTNVDLGREVAIKVLLPHTAEDPEVVARFRQEARAAAAIGHPGIVDVLDLGRLDDGAEFIVMEHLRGETLSARLEREAPLPAALALEVLGRLAAALQAAHERGIVHRDLKPDNIVLMGPPAPGVKILDFGISKLSGADRAVRTATGALLGTPLYISPEGVNADKDLGPPADLYTLGVIAYEMLCGRPPFRAAKLAALLLQIASEPAPPLAEQRSGLPAPLCELVMQLLAKEPAARPQSAAEVSARVEQLKADLPPGDVVELGPPATSQTLAPTDREAALATIDPTSAAVGAAADDDWALAETAATAGPPPPPEAVEPPAPVKRGPLLLIVVAILAVVGVLTYRKTSRTPPPDPTVPDAVAGPADAAPQLEAAPPNQPDHGAQTTDSGAPADARPRTKRHVRPRPRAPATKHAPRPDPLLQPPASSPFKQP